MLLEFVAPRHMLDNFLGVELCTNLFLNRISSRCIISLFGKETIEPLWSRTYLFKTSSVTV